MPLLQSPSKYLELVNRSDILEICKPLFKNTPITHFDYSCYYTDYSYFGFSMNESFDAAAISLDIQPTFDEIAYYGHPFAYYSPDTSPPLNSPKAISQIQFGCAFDTPNRFYIINRFANYYETCGFAICSSKMSASLPMIFLNKMELFNQFILYFREKANDYITVLSMNRISQPENEIFTCIQNEGLLSNFDSESLIKEMELSSYHIIVHGASKALTKREIECLQLLKNNVTTKAIANHLCISHRTVDTHINNIKIKLGCHFETDLIKIAKENNL